MLAAAYLAASSPTDRVEDVQKAPSDKRSYRGVTLDNGLKVMLVSDETAVTASAAVDVNVGAFSDPDDRPGLAHFCEHMLFLSTAKYPVENEYFRFLSQHGGYANAYTASTHTNYFFSVQPEQLERALDRFSQFFVSPLFNEGAVGRELHAVASEHSKNLQSDPWRKRQLLKSFASPKHPYSKFSTGSIETLLPDNSTAQVVKLREQLVHWYNSSYSAPLMTLTVSGKQDLDTLQGWAASKFSAVPRREGVRRPDWSDAPRPYADGALPLAYVVRPVKQLQEVTLQWPLPGVEHLLEEKPLRTLGFLLGGESRGSLLSLLIERGWAEGLLAGAGDSEADFSIFELRVQLTPSGAANWTRVVSTVFSSVRACAKGLRAQQEAERIHKMVHDVDELGFNYKEEEEASGYTSDLASSLQLFGAAQLLHGPSVTTAHNTTRLLGLLGQLTPQRLILLSSDYTKNLTGDVRSEHWYGTEYAELELPQGALAAWSEPPELAELALPLPNAFLPDDFALLSPAHPPLHPAATAAASAAGNAHAATATAATNASAAATDDERPSVEPPNLLFNSSEAGTLWHRTETSFGLPMGAMHVLWAVPRVAESARGCVKAQLLELMVREQLRAVSYDAGVAGSTVAFGASTRGFELSAYGFSQRLPVLLDTLLEAVVGLEADGDAAQKRFKTQKELLTRALVDSDKQSPQGFASQLSQHLTRRVHYLPKQLLRALEPLSLADVANFTASLVRDDATSVEGMVLGNLDEAGAAGMLRNTTRRLVARALPFAARPKQAVVDLSGRALVHAFRHPNGDEPNGAVQLVAQLGRLGPRDAAVAELLSDMLKQPFFDELRTTQQLGYIVGSALSAPQAVYSLGFVVQSAVQPPAEVARRVLAFLEGAPAILDGAKDEFANYVAAAQTQLREPPKRLSQAADMLWPRVSEGTYRFGWPQRVARAMDNVTLHDVQAMLASVLKPATDGGVGRLLVLVHGKDHALPSDDELSAKIGKLLAKPSATGGGGHGHGHGHGGGHGGGQWDLVRDASEFRGRATYHTALVAERTSAPLGSGGGGAPGLVNRHHDTLDEACCTCEGAGHDSCQAGDCGDGTGKYCWCFDATCPAGFTSCDGTTCDVASSSARKATAPQPTLQSA